MKYISIITILLTCPKFLFSQSWTDSQIKSARTADSVTVLSAIEKDIFLWVNLARLYPQDFVRIELTESRPADKNYTSLKRTMQSAKPCKAIVWNSQMQNTAGCLAQQQHANGKTGHKRTGCVMDYKAECLAYGNGDGKQVVFQLLFDYDVPDLGHRKILLRQDMQSMGVSTTTHPKYEQVSVLDFQ
jgi:uncharacterized protein YkwD